MIIPGHKLKDLGVITPFENRTVIFGKTFGVGPCGYDVRVDQDLFIRSGHFKLASTIEYFNLPKDIVGVVYNKSTWARLGLNVFTTIIEPGWRGYLTLEMLNAGYEDLSIDRGSPIAQIIFNRLEEPTKFPYNGKYMDQPRGPVKAILEREDEKRMGVVFN